MANYMENCWTAIVTPMKEAGEIDYEAYEQLVEFQMRNSVSDILVNGTTGESPTTTDAEKKKLLEITLNKKASVAAGCGTNDTAHSEHLVNNAVQLGINRILLIDCYYNGPSSLELRNEYYGYLCTRFPQVKFIAYVIPGRTGCELSVEDLAALHNQFPNLDTVKEATGNLERMKETRALSNDLCIMSGDDDLTYKIMTDKSINASGVISVASNIAPKTVQEMCIAVNSENKVKAQELSQKLAPLFSLITVKNEGQKFRNPVPFKTAMAGLGMIEYFCRRPLGKMTRNATQHVRATLKKIWSENPDILEPIQAHYGIDIEQRLATDAYWPHY
ncbi:MAG: 4-hydroxy-tetrahydrodipicolinate synthase [Candidatus Micrarchaeota archaeon]